MDNEEEEEVLQSLRGPGVNRVYVHRTSLAIPQGSGVRCNTTSPFAGSRHCVSKYLLYWLTGISWALGGGGEESVLGSQDLSMVCRSMIGCLFSIRLFMD